MTAHEELVDSIREILTDYPNGDIYDYAEGFERIKWTVDGFDAGQEANRDS